MAVLALLVLSLGLTTAVFVGQFYLGDRAAAASVLKGLDQLRVRGQISRALLNAGGQPPLALVRPSALGVDRVLVTSWPNDSIAGDTAHGGGPSRIAPIPGRPASGDTSIDGVGYAYLVLPGPQLGDVPADMPPYHNVILLEEVKARSVAGAINRLATAGAVAVLVTSLAAVALLRAMTRPLQAMTRASERIAAGDYDQRVPAGGASDEIGQLARSFNRMAYEVKHARELQRQFVANVSHDLRSPLTSIIGFSQALTEDGATTPWQRRTAEIINGEAQRLSRLTVDLLDLSRLEAGRLPLAMGVLDLRPLLRDIAARYQALPNTRGVRFVADLGDEPLPLRGDPDRLTQVVVNLLDNAFKFANAGGEVRLRAARRAGTAVVEVYNTGAGIAPDDLPRVFDRFYSGEHSRARQTGGSGIGLAIVRELAHAHGGAVTASSAQGQWAAMTVRLPLAPDSGENQGRRDNEFTESLHGANTDTTRLVV